MGLVLIYGILFATAAAIAVFWKRKIEETVALACFACILLLYLCGLTGWLPAGVYACVGLAVAALVYLVWRVVRDKTALLGYLLTPGLLACGLLGVGIWLAHQNRLLSVWDEFSHWGLVVKNMVCFDSFGNHPDATTCFKGYPPAAALFQYLWCKLNGSFQDACLIRASNLLSFSLLLPLFAKLNWRRCWAFVPLFFILACLPLTFFSGFYTELYVDALLGLLFAYILYSYFSAETVDSFLVVNLALASFVLTLVKAAGAGLTLIALIIIGVDWFRRSPKATSRRIGCLFAAGLPASLLVAKVSWECYLKLTNTGQAWAGMKGLTWPAVWEFIRGQAPEYRYTVLKNFIKATWQRELQPHLLPMNLLMWVLLLAAIAFLLLWMVKDKGQRRRIGVAAAGLFGGGVVYGASLLVLYLFTYTPYEAVRLASYERYMSTYLLGMLVFLVYLTVSYALQHVNGRAVVSSLAAVVAGLLLFADLKPCAEVTVKRQASIQKTIALQAGFAKLRQLSQSWDNQSGRLYFVCQQSKGWEYWIARYIVTPIKINDDFWSLGTPYGDGDVWTRPITCQEWQEQLKEFTHVYLYWVDDQFRQEFGAAFENPDGIQCGSLYQVVSQGEQITLRLADQ